MQLSRMTDRLDVTDADLSGATLTHCCLMGVTIDGVPLTDMVAACLQSLRP